MDNVLPKNKSQSALGHQSTDGKEKNGGMMT